MRATRTSEIGPLNGISETAIAAEAARPASAGKLRGTYGLLCQLS